MPFDRVEEAIEDIRQGKLVIVADDENRENEGDLIGAAAHVSPEMVNFMIRRAGGLICVGRFSRQNPIDEIGHPQRQDRIHVIPQFPVR